MMLRKKQYFQSRISGIDHDIRDISREIRQLKKILRKEEHLFGLKPGNKVDKSAGKADQDKADQDIDNNHKLASYLSAGSLHTISQHKFRSDLVRKQRLMMAGGIIILLAIILIFWHYLG